MLASLLMAIAIPDAFGERARLFAGGYVALQWAATRSSCWRRRPRPACAPRGCGSWIGSLWVGLLWIAGAIVPDEGARMAIWVAALVLDYGGPLAASGRPGWGAPRRPSGSSSTATSSSASRRS